MGQLATYSVWAEVAGAKARAEGLLEIALLADQVRSLVNAASNLTAKADSRLSERKIFPAKATPEQEAAAIIKMVKATENYLWLHGTGTLPQHWSKAEEAAILTRETFDLVRQQPAGQEGVKYADAVLWKVWSWSNAFHASMPLVPLSTPPLAPDSFQPITEGTGVRPSACGPRDGRQHDRPTERGRRPASPLHRLSGVRSVLQRCQQLVSPMKQAVAMVAVNIFLRSRSLRNSCARRRRPSPSRAWPPRTTSHR